MRDEAVTLWAAGHEPTSTALTWTVRLLSRSPAARARLEAELDDVLAGRPPTIDDYDRLVWTQQIAKEALRLYPPVWLVPAVARPGATPGGARSGRHPRLVQPVDHAPRPALVRAPRRVPPRALGRRRAGGGAGGGAGPRLVPVRRWPADLSRRPLRQARSALVLATLAQRCRLDLPATEVAPRAGLLLQPELTLVATVRGRDRAAVH